MNRTVILGVSLIASMELLTLVQHAHRFVLAASGVALTLALLSLRRVLGRDPEQVAEADADELGDSLRRWLAATETTIRWTESSRRDWDLHLRPMLARRYELATGQRQSKDPAAYHAMGRMLFGADLWEWVNPNNITHSGDHHPGPGRGALEEILRKLEQV
jgi:hypothetical protein